MIGLLIMPALVSAQEAEPTTCSSFSGTGSGKGEDACLKANCLWNPVKPDCTGVYIKEAKDLVDIINKIGNWIFVTLLAVAGVMMIYAGFLWVTAGGNPEGATKGKQMLTNAIIGLVVALLAKGAVMAILKILGST